MRYLSLFSGIEAATVAWEPLGWEPVAFSEIEPFPCAVLAHHYPDVPNLGDVYGLTADHLRDLAPELLVGGPPCFPAGTLIATDRGLRPIETLVAGDLVVSHLGRMQPVVRVGSKVAPTVCVTGQGHPGFITTAEHPFWVRRKWSQSTRRNGVPVRLTGVSDPAWEPASDLRGAHWACAATWPALPIPEPTAEGHESRLFAVSEDLLLLAGAYLGDGWTRINQRRGCVVLGLNPDKLAKLMPLLLRLGGAAISTERTTQRVTLSSRSLARWLAEHFGSGASGKRIPQWALGMRRTWRQALLDGYLLTDGHAKPKGGFSALTVSRELALTLRMLANTLGYSGSVHFRQVSPTTVIEGRTVNQQPYYTVSLSPSTRSSFEEFGYRWQCVRNVEPTGSKEVVYDIEIATDHSYWADGIAVHNCQSFSTAGRRGGMDDVRGQLAQRYCDLALGSGARWMVLENVPGLLSSGTGRDFAGLLGQLTGTDVPAPAKGKWGTCGVLPASTPEHFGVAWRVLDAQYFGVAQRRRRVFLIGYRGDWRRPAAVLLEPHSLRGDPQPRREAGQDVTGTLSSRASGGGGLGTDFDLDGGVVGTLKANSGGGGWSNSADHAAAGYMIPVSSHTLLGKPNDSCDPEKQTTIAAYGGGNPGPLEVATCQTSHGQRLDFDSETFITHTPSAEGADASEDGTGRGTPPIVAFAENCRGEVRLEGGDGLTTGCLSTGGGKPGQGAPTIAFDSKASGRNGFGVGEVSPTLRAMGSANSHANGGGQVAVATYALGSHAGCADGGASNRSHASGGPVGLGVSEELAYALRSGRTQTIAAPMMVRRLTPGETAQLQGFSPTYTRIPVRTYKTPPAKDFEKYRDLFEQQPDGSWIRYAADGPQYKAHGNSMCVNVMSWLGRRIAKLESLLAVDSPCD